MNLVIRWFGKRWFTYTMVTFYYPLSQFTMLSRLYDGWNSRPRPLGGQFPIKIHFPRPPCHLLDGRELFSHLCVYYSISMSIINADRLCIICGSCMCNSVDQRGKYRPVCRRGWERRGSEQLSHTFTQHCIALALVNKLFVRAKVTMVIGYCLWIMYIH